MSGLGYARAAYDFVSEHQEDVSLRAGDIVLVLEEVDESWLKGKNHNKVGYFPRTYVESVRLPHVSTAQRVFLATRTFTGEEAGDLSFDDGQCFDCNFITLSVHNVTVLVLVKSRDVTEFKSEFECCRNLTVFGKSKIRHIYRLVQVEVGFIFCCTKLSLASCPSLTAPTFHVCDLRTTENDVSSREKTF